MQHDDVNAKKLTGDGSGLLNIGNQAQIIYVSKTGNDSNSGLNVNESKLTINGARTTGVALLPSVSNQIVLKGIGAGDYNEDVELPEWMHLDFKDSGFDGRLTVSDNTISTFRSMENTVLGDKVMKKANGLGLAIVNTDLLIVGDLPQEGLAADSGEVHLNIGSMRVDGGIGVKAKNGSMVSFMISDIYLSNGGIGIGTRTLGGAGNSFSGNILYVKDDGTGILLESRVIGDVINVQGGSLLVDTLYDMGASTTLKGFVTESSGNRIADPAATINITVAGDSNNSLRFKGDWDASTNTPTLLNTDINVQGFVYKCSVSGTVDFGAGNVTFTIGDIIFNNGTVWDHFDTGTAILPNIQDQLKRYTLLLS